MSSTTAGFSTVNRFAVLEDQQSKSAKSKKQAGSDGDISIKQRQGKENGKVDGGPKSSGVNGNANGMSNGNGNGKRQDHASQRSSNTQTVNSQTRSTVNGKTPSSTSTSKPPVPTAYLKTPAKKNSNPLASSKNTQQKSTLQNNDTSDQDQAQMEVNGVTQQIKHLKKDLSKQETEVKERVVQKKKKTDWEVPRKTLHGSIGEPPPPKSLFVSQPYMYRYLYNPIRSLALHLHYRLPSPLPPLPNPPHPPTPAHHSNNSPPHNHLDRRTPFQLSSLQQALYQSLRAVDEEGRSQRVERRDLVSYWGGCYVGGLSQGCGCC